MDRKLQLGVDEGVRHERVVSEMLRASLVRTREKLREFIRHHPDPGADALAVEWEAGDVLSRTANIGG